jgi:hypothetical protein
MAVSTNFHDLVDFCRQIDFATSMGGTAICFVLATPRQETRVEAVARSIRFLLHSLPVVGKAIPARFSPARRMGFAAGLRACVNSIRRRHATVPPIIVLRPAGQRLTLADVDEVIEFDPAPYESIRCEGSYFGREVFYKFEVFRLRGYDRVVYLDCDTLVVGDIASLWDPMQFADLPFFAAREEAAMGVHASVIGKFNTGVMVINRSLMGEAVWQRMVAMARRGDSYDGGDQGVINAYLADQGGLAGELDAGFNVPVRAKKEGQWDVYRSRLKVLHFATALKPWSAEHHHDWLFDEELKRLWDDAYRFVPGGSGPLSGARSFRTGSETLPDSHCETHALHP